MTFRTALRVGLMAAMASAGISVSVAELRAESENVAVEPSSTGGAPTFRRLSEAQYRRSIAQVFGSEIAIPGRFEPPVREEGLLAIGNSKVVVTSAGLEQYLIRAREISAQVLGDAHRNSVLACREPDSAKFDEPCASQFFTKYGRLLFRRPMTNAEVAATVAIARNGALTSGSFHAGLKAGLTSLLISPSFIFRMETVDNVRSPSGATKLDAYSLATRISFLLWDGPPDQMLLDAAASGALDKPEGLAAEVDRMIASPQFEQGVRAFFSDMFAFDQFGGLSKESKLYPIFSPQLRDDAQEQTLRTITNHLVNERGDYRDLFTAKQTYLSRSLGALYGVPVDARAFGGWMPYTFPADAPQGGLLTLAGFAMLDPSHEGRSSPTIRGKSVRENFLCQPVPMPPADVNFSIVQDVNDPNHKTARDRLKAHQNDPVCAGCHAITDPIGLSLENFNPVGQYRSHENGALIDSSGEFDGKPFKNVAGFMSLLRDSPEVPACVVQRAYEYGVGRPAEYSDTKWLDYTNQQFDRSGFQFPALLRQIATSPAFRAVSTKAYAAVSIKPRSWHHEQME